MQVILRMTSLPVGSEIGPLFNVTPLPSGVAIPGQVTLTELLNPAGVLVDVPDGTVSISLQSTGICTNSTAIILPTTTTTSTCPECVDFNARVLSDLEIGGFSYPITVNFVGLGTYTLNPSEFGPNGTNFTGLSIPPGVYDIELILNSIQPTFIGQTLTLVVGGCPGAPSASCYQILQGTWVYKWQDVRVSCLHDVPWNGTFTSGVYSGSRVDLRFNQAFTTQFPCPNFPTQNITTSTTTTLDTRVCFTQSVEGPSPDVQSTFTPQPTLFNGKVWYIVNSTLDGVVDLVYWASELNKWVATNSSTFPLAPSNPATGVLQTLDNNNNPLPISSSTYQWQPTNSHPTFPPSEFVCDTTALTGIICQSTAGSCSNVICFKQAQEGALGPRQGSFSPQPTLFNGKVWYDIATNNPIPGAHESVYWASELNKWVATSSAPTSPATNILQTLDAAAGINDIIPVSVSGFNWMPYDEPDFYDCSLLTAQTGTICDSYYSCTDQVCFFYQSEDTYPFAPKVVVSPQPTLVNGRVWYKFEYPEVPNRTFYVYYDNTTTFGPFGAWVQGILELNNSAIPPLANNNIYSYIQNPSATSTLLQYPAIYIGDYTRYDTNPAVVVGNDSYFFQTSLGFCNSTICPNLPVCGQTFEGYGYLYNWFTVGGDNGRADGGIVNKNQPGFGSTDIQNSWRVPTFNDFSLLRNYTGQDGNNPISLESAINLKTVCTAPFTIDNGLWNAPHDATNKFKWSGIPGGRRTHFDGSFEGIGSYSFWMSSQLASGDTPYALFLSNDASIVITDKKQGSYIRLVRPATLEELDLPDGTTSNQNSLLPHYVGNSRTYITVKIGEQIWTAQNLIDTKYNNGVTIPEVTDLVQWITATTSARCSYPVNPDRSQGRIALCGFPN